VDEKLLEHGKVSAVDEKPSSRWQNTVLVLQGGGALGAYQAGAYGALAEGGYTPDWIAGISIGAINAAIIAGNPPEQRTDKLRAFWEDITGPLCIPAPEGDIPHQWFNGYNALAVMCFGLPKFFTPRFPMPFFQWSGAPGAISYYDTAPLRETLERLVDFERINAGHTRLSLGAVEVATGNFTYFDNTQERIRPEHVLASGALPPGFPPIEIDGRHYWDGGLVSNTPLAHVLRETEEIGDSLIFQVDLWSAKGSTPRNLFDVEDRRKDIVYSSRTRLNTDIFRRELMLRKALAKLAARLPQDERDDPALADALALAQHRRVSVVHLIYKHKRYESHSRDYQFSRASMHEHWQDGQADTRRILAQSDWLEPDDDDEGMRVFDLN
jgi:NTE family protein